MKTIIVRITLTVLLLVACGSALVLADGPAPPADCPPNNPNCVN